MKIITCISDTKNKGYQEFLVTSCNYYNLDLITLEHQDYWLSNRNKDQYLLEYLNGIPGDEIVMFTDGYDTMLLCSEDEIIDKYREFGRALVFTAEKNCWPDKSLSRLYPPSPTQFRFLNCGGFIGKAGLIRKLIEKYNKSPYHYGLIRKKWWSLQKSLFGKDMDPDHIFSYSNQYYWTHIFFRNKDLIALDYYTNIFLELTTMMKDFPATVKVDDNEIMQTEIYHKEIERLTHECQIEGNRILNTLTGTKPCQMHFNGQVVKLIAFNHHFDKVMPWLSQI